MVTANVDHSLPIDVVCDKCLNKSIDLGKIGIMCEVSKG
jgi:hypothetical protein